MIEIEPEIAGEIRRERNRFFHDTLDTVVFQVGAYGQELGRDDLAHRARLRIRRDRLLLAILECAEAYYDRDKPITQSEVEATFRFRPTTVDQ